MSWYPITCTILSRKKNKIKFQNWLKCKWKLKLFVAKRISKNWIRKQKNWWFKKKTNEEANKFRKRNDKKTTLSIIHTSWRFNMIMITNWHFIYIISMQFAPLNWRSADTLASPILFSIIVFLFAKRENKSIVLPPNNRSSNFWSVCVYKWIFAFNGILNAHVFEILWKVSRIQ